MHTELGQLLYLVVICNYIFQPYESVYSTVGSFLNVLKKDSTMSLSSEQLLSSFGKVRYLIVPVKETKVCSVLIPCRTYGVYAKL